MKSTSCHPFFSLLFLSIILPLSIPAQVPIPAKMGGKAAKRWIDYHIRRADGSGNMADPKVTGRALYEAANSKITSHNKTGSTNWIPAGPDHYAIPMDSSWEPGIGRINCIAFHPTDSNIFWVGVAQGGVWKTIDHGQTWFPQTDDLPMLRISDIALDPNDPNTLYISVGDYAYIGVALWTDGRKRHTHYGIGVYKSIDGGSSWKATNLSFSNADFDGSLTRRVFVNPANSNHVIAAGTQGIWKSMDAGNTFSQVMDSLLWDIEQCPQNPNVLYASGGFVGYLNEGTANIMKSTNFGNTWTVLNTGIPAQNDIQRIELAISPQDSNTLYALTADMSEGFGGLYRSTNSGLSWTKMSGSPNILEWWDGGGGGGQGWYDLAIVVDPNDKNRIYTGGINMWTSSNGGANWEGVSYWRNDYGKSIHADHHQYKYNPADSNFYVCCDGGLYRTRTIVPGSWNDANFIPGYQWPTKWTKLSNGMQTTSFYRLGLCRDSAGTVIAGAQDNSTYYYNTQDWYNIIGGDGMDCILSPWDPDSLIGSWQYGGFASSPDGGFNLNTGFSSGIFDNGEWTTPVLMHPQSSKTIYTAFGDVWMTNDDGFTWTPISSFPFVPALGSANPSSAFEISAADADVMYVAKRVNFPYSEPGAVWVTTDGGFNWVDRTAGLPDSLYITDIQADDSLPQKAWVSVGGFESGVKLFRTTNAGQTWVNISGNFPNLPANCIAVHPGMEHDPMYVGTDAGVYYVNDTIPGWILYSDDLPNVIVSDLEIHKNSHSIWAATFGRGLWKVSLKDTFPLPVHNAGLALNSAELKIWPNPSGGNLNFSLKNIRVPNAELIIVDQLGREIFREVLVFPADSYAGILSANLKSGVYHLSVRFAAGTLSGKIVVE